MIGGMRLPYSIQQRSVTMNEIPQSNKKYTTFAVKTW